ncbi:MAG: prolipoprotein diacylglyceryl transferase [Gammaproteobacteria bacterium]|nr:prolipoprotein diacylglyceryl transferase [Gammaproteobacteria bacterium]
MLTYPNIDPVAIALGPLKIRWYGISYVAGILGAWWLLSRRGAGLKPAWTPEQVGDLVFYCALGLLVGGRLGEVLFYNPGYYFSEPLAILRIWEGGMSFHGGLIGGLTGAWLFSRHAGRGFFEVSDFLAPVVPVGLFFGRIANFINGELWGTATDVPWAMIFPEPRAGGVPRHPSQLYEAALEGLLLFGILWWYSSRPRPAMAVTGLFFILYGAARIGVEFVREPDAHIGYLAGGWVTLGQTLSLPMIILGMIMMVVAHRAKAPDR